MSSKWVAGDFGAWKRAKPRHGYEHVDGANEWKGLPSPELAAWQPAATKCHGGKRKLSSTHLEGKSMSIVHVGIGWPARRTVSFRSQRVLQLRFAVTILYKTTV